MFLENEYVLGLYAESNSQVFFTFISLVATVNGRYGCQ